MAINEYESSIVRITQYMTKSLNHIPISQFNKLEKRLCIFCATRDCIFVIV